MPAFKKATKYNSFLKLGLSGLAGSGKTYSALSIATHLSEKKIALIDTEPGAASKYANLFSFDVCELSIDDSGRDIDKPFTPQRYMDAIKAAYDSGEYDVLIIDGISPEWDDAGGVLQTVDELTRRFKSEGEKAATRNAWSVVTPAHKKFINTILRTRLHVICTMRAKKETIAEKDDKGRPIGKKVVMEAIQREDVPYVFDVMGILTDKDMIIDKTRCPDLDDQIYHKPGQEVANIIREWLKGEPLPERLGYAPDLDEQHRIVDAPVDRSTHVTDGNGQKPLASVRSATVGGNGKTNGTTVEEGATDAPATDQQLTSIRKLCQHLGKPEPEHPETMSYQDAKALITQLSHEYNEQKQHRKAS